MTDERQGQDEPTPESPKDTNADGGAPDANDKPTQRDEQLAEDEMPDANVMVNKD